MYLRYSINFTVNWKIISYKPGGVWAAAKSEMVTPVQEGGRWYKCLMIWPPLSNKIFKAKSIHCFIITYLCLKWSIQIINYFLFWKRIDLKCHFQFSCELKLPPTIIFFLCKASVLFINQLVAVFSLGKDKRHPSHFPKNPLFLLLKWENLPCSLVSFLKIRRKSIQDKKTPRSLLQNPLVFTGCGIFYCHLEPACCFCCWNSGVRGLLAILCKLVQISNRGVGMK